MATNPRKDARFCHWCGEIIDVATTGRLPKFCSETCRHRAWEVRRAARLGQMPSLMSANELLDALDNARLHLMNGEYSRVDRFRIKAAADQVAWAATAVGSREDRGQPRSVVTKPFN